MCLKKPEFKASLAKQKHQPLASQPPDQWLIATPTACANFLRVRNLFQEVTLDFEIFSWCPDPHLMANQGKVAATLCVSLARGS